ncbi:hypothetical protein [Streptomyces sp. NBC_00775]|nr:hypothetical protein OIC96_00770 [Streptomyces sp. NBC_00775]
MQITAPSLRSGYFNDPTIWTEIQIDLFTTLLEASDSGDKKARSHLESQLLHIQSAKHANPFVSCSRRWSVAQGFALFNDTPGYVLSIVGSGAGFDFAAVRERHGLFGDAVDHLFEFGVPRVLGNDFTVVQVHYVQPFGRPTEVVFP